MSITIKDIAKIAGVSHTTVSRALNDNPLIRENTKEKIKAIAKELGYEPNYNAKSLALDRSYNIGLFFSTITEGTSPQFFYEAIKGVNGSLQGKYNLIVRGIDDYVDVHPISSKNFDGIVLMSQSKRDDAFIYQVLEKGIPLVVLNRELHHAGIANILSDDRKGAYKGAEYLISKGHRRFAIIEGKKGFESSQERKEGFLQALMDHNLSMHKGYMVQGSYNLESGHRAMKELLSLPDLPTAVFCLNDDMAVGAMKAITEAGLSIPRDISVMGFDDNIFASFLSPALTTIKRPIEEISKKGTEKLMQLIEHGEVDRETLYINTEIKIRESVSVIE